MSPRRPSARVVEPAAGQTAASLGTPPGRRTVNTEPVTCPRAKSRDETRAAIKSHRLREASVGPEATTALKAAANLWSISLALAYGRTEELRQELLDRVRAMGFDELRALKVKMT
jgi:hypothetical protein